MSRPDDIPQDVWDVAYRLHGFTEYDEVVSRAGSVADLHAAVDHDVSLIARAILAERERAANVARAAVIRSFDGPCPPGVAQMGADEVAAAIRKNAAPKSDNSNFGTVPHQGEIR